jgi:hypothetical protein
MAGEALANIPYKEQPTRARLEGYVRNYDPTEDLAWGDLYPQLCSWLSDQEEKKRAKASGEAQGEFIFK